MRENAFAKSRRYLIEGRLVVVEIVPGRIRATCRGDGQIYILRWVPESWWCSCPARSDQCAHLRALRTVTAPEASAWV